MQLDYCVIALNAVHKYYRRRKAIRPDYITESICMTRFRMQYNSDISSFRQVSRLSALLRLVCWNGKWSNFANTFATHLSVLRYRTFGRLRATGLGTTASPPKLHQHILYRHSFRLHSQYTYSYSYRPLWANVQQLWVWTVANFESKRIGWGPLV
jgi:hypothetical protein